MKSLHRCLWIVPHVLCFMIPMGLMAQSKAISTEDLTAQAEVVAVGKVKEAKGEWDETHSRIRTRVTLSVEEYLKGSGGSSLEVYVPGGEVDGVGELYSHTAKFSVAEEVVVFAERDGKGRFRVAGGSQGKHSITKDEASGKRVVSHYWTLDDFKGKVNKAKNGQGKK